VGILFRQMADQDTVLIGGGVGAAFTVTALVFYRFIIPMFNAANHHRVRTVCCGQSCVTSLDIEETTPPAPPQVVTVAPLKLRKPEEPESKG